MSSKIWFQSWDFILSNCLIDSFKNTLYIIYYDDSYDGNDDYNYDYPSVEENEVQPISQGYGEAISTGYGVPRAEPLGDNYQGSTAASTKGPGSDGGSYDDYSNVVDTGDYSYEDDYYNSDAIEVQQNPL